MPQGTSLHCTQDSSYSADTSTGSGTCVTQNHKLLFLHRGVDARLDHKDRKEEDTIYCSLHTHTHKYTLYIHKKAYQLACAFHIWDDDKMIRTLSTAMNHVFILLNHFYQPIKKPDLTVQVTYAILYVLWFVYVFLWLFSPSETSAVNSEVNSRYV